MKKVIIFDLDGVIFDSVELMHDYGVSTAVEESDDQLVARMKEYTTNKLKVPMFDGVLALLVRLHSHADLVINTSASKENCLPLLERDGILDLFTFIAAKELSTSKIEKFKLIADRFNVELDDMIFITDTIDDVREAYAAKIPTIAVTWGVHTTEDFMSEPKDSLIAIVHTMNELESFLLKKGHMV